MPRHARAEIAIETTGLQARVRPYGYVSGIAAGTLVDRATGARDLGFGLGIIDFLLEPKWDDPCPDLGGLPAYERDPALHGSLPHRYVEGPQICTQAGTLSAQLVHGHGFVAVRQSYRWTMATYGRRAGSAWEQTLLFPEAERFFLVEDRVTSANDCASLILRMDMPGHIRHSGGDTFTEVHLSHHGTIPAAAFAHDFPPDARFLYWRDRQPVPRRVIRAYRVGQAGGSGPWVAGMCLDPTAVYQGWCHQRGYVCMIEEVGGRAVAAGEFFSTVHVVGFFDSVHDMESCYDRFRGATRLRWDPDGWDLSP